MKRVIILIVVVVLILGISVGIAYGIKAKNKNAITPTFNFMLDSEQSKIWVGTFQLAWNAMLEDMEIEKAEIEGGNTPLVNELNEKTFTREQLSEKNYYIKVGEPTFEFGNEVKREVEEKFGIKSDMLSNIFPKNENEIPLGSQVAIYSILNKNFNFINEFDRLENDKFKKNSELIKYFGINDESDEKLYSNVSVLFYNSKQDFAVKLNTKENEEIYLYRTNEEKTFDNTYKYMLNKDKAYKGSKTFEKIDFLKVPYISLKESISYNELLDKKIINEQKRVQIICAIQDITFNLNNKGGNLASEALIKTLGDSSEIVEKPEKNTPRIFNYSDNLYMFLKEKSKDLPYMALKIDNTDYLENA